jgi:hypothetical protein
MITIIGPADYPIVSVMGVTKSELLGHVKTSLDTGSETIQPYGHLGLLATLGYQSWRRLFSRMPNLSRGKECWLDGLSRQAH